MAHRLAATVRKGAARVPEVVVRDRASDRIGVVMGNVGPYVQLRPLSGGREWDVHPDDVRELTAPEVLSARVAEANRISARRHP
ncbi:hypothetical protein JJV70_11475 [Streptomyces sp. JJ66]|nr:hypothetical protein [Streptomyces sp. JJ66]